MNAFLCNFIPRSVNSSPRTKMAYYQSLRYSYAKYVGNSPLLAEELYGVVYYFYRGRNDLDADNLSKPIWDALNNSAYVDDKLIRLRCSGLFDLESEDISILDLSTMPDIVLNDFIDMINNKEKHILYIELGSFDHDMLKLGWEK